MRLLKLGIYHPRYLRSFYAMRPELETLPYSAQHTALIDDRFGSSDFWTEALRKLGYETAEIIANAEALQNAWANEHDLDFDENSWLFEISTAQVKHFCPDVLLVADYSTFTAEFLRNLRRENPAIRLILGWCGAPYVDTTVFGEWDVALSCVPELVADFTAAGLRSFHVNHAFDPRVLKDLEDDTQPGVDFAFVGSIVKQSQFHIERESLLLYLLRHTDLQIWADIDRPAVKAQAGTSIRRRISNFVSVGRSVVRGRSIEESQFGKRMERNSKSIANGYISEEIARRALPPSFGIDMFKQFRNSRVVFNNHIDISRRSASNMRLFEATGVGTCLITDWKKNLSELFEPEKDVLTYKSAEECVEKVNYILEHEAERRSIAAAGQARTLRDHTYDNRAKQIDEAIRSFLGH